MTLLWAVFACALVSGINPASVYGQVPSTEEQQWQADQLLEEGWQALRELEGDPLPSLQDALAIYQDIGDRAGESRTLNTLGYLYDLRGQPRQAFEHYQRALTIASEIENRTEQSRALQGLGDICQTWGGNVGLFCAVNSERERQALEFYQQALAIAREAGDLTQQANALGKLGYIYEKLEQYEHAVESYEQQLAIYRQIEVHPWNLSFLLRTLGHLYSGLGRDAEAIDIYAEFVQIMERFRANLQELPAAEQQEFTQEFVTSTYQAYANLLRQQGRKQAAQQILELLKVPQ
ncbi:tetratricopeptide repeat protein [Halomicronema hongdechloris]|uniref:tetratricopeptide repeat protein n=1 Tax=Halomicronema hongdechloris TaxID=1209493 RepID=UPI001650D72D|nr:tetratricopeptide repeat protein [Halomicronema hongdechloris]